MKISKNYSYYNHTLSASFKAHSFKLNNFDDVNCAYCGDKMLSRATIDEMFNINSYLSLQMFEIAKKNRHYLKPFQNQVLSFIEKVQNRSKVNTDVHLLNSTKRFASFIVENDLISKYDTIKDIVNALGTERQKYIIKFNEKSMKERLANTRCYSNLHSFIYCPVGLNIRKSDTSPLGKAINAIAQNMDNSNYSVRGYILNNIRGKTPEQFYKELFLQSESTMEHIQPRSKNGRNEISNYLCVCRKCNSERKSMSLTEYAKTLPDNSIKKNIDDQLEFWFREIPKLIRDNKLPKEYENYALDTRNTLISQSNGKFGYREIVIHL